MEAATAGQSAGSTGAEGAEAAQEGAEEQGGLDTSALTKHMDDALSKALGPIGERLDSFEERLPTSETEGEGEDDFGLDLEALGGDGLFEGEGDVDPEKAQQFLGNLMKTVSEQAVEKAVGPLMEHMTVLQAQNDSQALKAKYPELGEPEVAQATVDRLETAVRGMGLDPASADARPILLNPAFIELAHQAGKAEQAASGESAHERSDLELESGATAGQGAGDRNEGRAIVDAGRKNTFWG